MIPGWSPETASSLALAPPRRVPRHRDLRGRRPGHDPLRREGRGSYQPRSDPHPLRSRRFKRLSAVPSAPTWRRGPSCCVLERPRTPRRAPRTPRAARATYATAHARTQSLMGAVVSRSPPRLLAGGGRHGRAPGFGPVITVIDVCPDLPSNSLLAILYTSGLLPLQWHLQVAFALWPILQNPSMAGSVGGKQLRGILRGPAPGWWGSQDRNSGFSVLFSPALKVPSADLWFLRFRVGRLLLACLFFSATVKISEVSCSITTRQQGVNFSFILQRKHCDS